MQKITRLFAMGWLAPEFGKNDDPAARYLIVHRPLSSWQHVASFDMATEGETEKVNRGARRQNSG